MKKMKVKIINIREYNNEEFEKVMEHYILKGYTPKYESFRVSFNDFGGPGHYFILMEKKMKNASKGTRETIRKLKKLKK